MGRIVDFANSAEIKLMERPGQAAPPTEEEASPAQPKDVA
jgi:hypothetical protein